MKGSLIRSALLGIAIVVPLNVVLEPAVHSGSKEPFNRSAQVILASGRSPKEEMVSRLIVKPRVRTDARLANALRAFDASGLSKTAGIPMAVLRPMSGKGYVIKLDQPVTLSEARVIAERLMRTDSNVEYAEPDRIMYPLATKPTDPGYFLQWHYFAPAGTSLGGANLPNAWDITKGNATITVAVIDTGYRPHVDLGTVIPGYDFITDITIANDGDGRDADAQDPGDWVAADECGLGEPAENSSWHGTHVAGTIAAMMNNGIGGTGIAPNVNILPVRVLGKCGGLTSDIADGMRWAAGLSVPGVPINPKPAHVLNMSLGGDGACSATFQSAAIDIVNAGKVIVAATGNDNSVNVNQPANCVGVIAVTAHAIDGNKASYATVGTETTISAPGGDGNFGVFSLFNTGTTIPVADSYASMVGTSMAAPHVSGVVALMLSVKPSLTPAEIKSYLQVSARPHPAGSYCATSGIGLCGSGLLDAVGALTAGDHPTVVLENPSQVVAPNTTVSLVGNATAYPPWSIKSYLWTQITGPVVVAIDNSDTASATFISPAVGTFSFLLTVTDTADHTGTAAATVRVNSPPVLTPVAAQTVTAGNPLTFMVGATDVDGGTPIFNSVSLPSGATLSAQGVFSWPFPTPAGSYTMTYYASDSDGAKSELGVVSITVNPIEKEHLYPGKAVGDLFGCTISTIPISTWGGNEISGIVNVMVLMIPALVFLIIRRR